MAQERRVPQEPFAETDPVYISLALAVPTDFVLFWKGA
jgi:hypothetical protein